jgi:hypothetical protein
MMLTVSMIVYWGRWWEGLVSHPNSEEQRRGWEGARGYCFGDEKKQRQEQPQILRFALDDKPYIGTNTRHEDDKPYIGTNTRHEDDKPYFGTNAG